MVNHPPVATASDRSLSKEQVVNASSLFTASDVDGNRLLYFFYDNTAAATSGHFTVNGVVQAAGTTFAVTAAQLAQTTFTAGRYGSSDDLFVNVWDGIAFSGPQEFHVNVAAQSRADGDGAGFLRRERTGHRRIDAVLGERRRRRQPAVLLLRQHRGRRERALHGQRRGAGGGHDLRGHGGAARADHLHGGNRKL